MCFSTQGSFIVGTALIATGTVCVKKSHDTDKNYLLFALIPLFFGLQQVFEGFVWLGLLHSYTILTRIFSYAYVFFAFSFWPAYVPISVYLTEKHENAVAKRVLLISLIIGCGAALAAFLLVMPGYFSLSAKVVSHSISYSTTASRKLDNLFTLIYLLAVITPFLIVSDKKLKLFGLLLFCSAIAAMIIFQYAFTSVWCFFAAVLSIYIGYIIYGLRENKETSSVKFKLT